MFLFAQLDMVVALSWVLVMGAGHGCRPFNHGDNGWGDEAAG